MISFTGQRMRPPALVEPHRCAKHRGTTATSDRPASTHIGSRQNDPPKRSIQVRVRSDTAAVDEVDPDVLVHLQRICRAEHRHGSEHVPLRLEERVGVVAVGGEKPAAGCRSGPASGQMYDLVDEYRKNALPALSSAAIKTSQTAIRLRQ